ncbi:hypothetical protein GCM10010215_59510 [Streptomyces virginiae]|uniref:Uncharacterized protein n=1 Tax=Streptomyces virginiae TaxID=1961 RepID=A0ABQ3NTP1_STRVG|nr:hypothetical protein [Streptomyces virginiae]GGQ27319.1 hypothetical protein GCM10010215_59510 [Streptomyces virginiae]GHI16150.1 hypothetical protein Scinn_56130 [Streptomyces virginiae]
MLPLGTWLCLRTLRPVRQRTGAGEPSAPALAALALTVGVVGGIYRIGGWAWPAAQVD